MEQVILCQTFCILIIAVLVISILLQKGKKENTDKAFLILCFFAIGFFIVNIITELTEGHKEVETICFLFNLFCFYGTDAILISFIFYLKTLLKNKKDNKTKVISQIVILTSIISIITVTILSITGGIFKIVDGRYVEGDLVFIAYIFSGTSLLELLIAVLINKKHFSKKQLVIILLYLAIPTIALVLEAAFALYTASLVGITISILLIFVFIVDTDIEQTKSKQEMFEEISNTDLLTGMNNRRMYYQRINDISKDSNVAVIFCDINGLKSINDHFGHVKGDEYIKTFGNIMVKIFGKKDTYRISGDEFIVILSNISFNDLVKKTNTLKEQIIQHDNIASFGYSYGSGSCYEKLLSEAEQKMYEVKNARGFSR